MSESCLIKTQVVTLRVPNELKSRLEQQAKVQGVSLNNLANYLLTTQLSQLETFAGIEQRLRTKNLSDLKQKIASLLDKVPHNPNVPEWDQL
ncbi:toxin-antitoxin system HicB family antitoxin [Thiothrix lacustris]|uniref:Toxin-antitoxin system HicB family antitoxin n=1 Tax=Thiothrix lacustris TaxID=525917 RepID=A0ABY9MTW7_9GAMM|nr:toxin-antitoxin system HicB family antitoxin [Thiothrix lacustris]WML92119.1 toxin-antitoxin system HicB family antitoxin [Thiothrix lacustris]